MILHIIFQSPHKPVKNVQWKKNQKLISLKGSIVLSEFQVNDSSHNEGTDTVVMGESG